MIILLTLTELLYLSKDFFVSLQYGERTYHYGRAEAVASADAAGERYERLGLGAFTKRGRPTLGGRWYTIMFEEGLQSQYPDDLLGSSRHSIFKVTN